jgi:hypothetical protein
MEPRAVYYWEVGFRKNWQHDADRYSNRIMGSRVTTGDHLMEYGYLPGRQPKFSWPPSSDHLGQDPGPPIADEDLLLFTVTGVPFCTFCSRQYPLRWARTVPFWLAGSPTLGEIGLSIKNYGRPLAPCQVRPTNRRYESSLWRMLVTAM